MPGLSSIKPQSVVDYLRSHCWTELSFQPGMCYVFELDEQEILVPLDPSIPGYLNRMHDVVDVLGFTENREQFDIYRDLLDFPASPKPPS